MALVQSSDPTNEATHVSHHSSLVESDPCCTLPVSVEVEDGSTLAGTTDNWLRNIVLGAGQQFVVQLPKQKVEPKKIELTFETIGGNPVVGNRPGEVTWEIIWKSKNNVSGKVYQNGLILQHCTTTGEATLADGTTKSKVLPEAIFNNQVINLLNLDYWEVWKVINGQVVPALPSMLVMGKTRNDQFRFSGFKIDPTKFSSFNYKMTGVAYWLDNTDAAVLNNTATLRPGESDKIVKFTGFNNKTGAGDLLALDTRETMIVSDDDTKNKPNPDYKKNKAFVEQIIANAKKMRGNSRRP